MSEQENYIVKINTALSNKPYFVKLTDPSFSIDRIFNEAISTLRNTGKPLESQQLEQLYKQHQIFNNGKVMQKGNLFSELEKKAQAVGNQQVLLAELDLVSSHSGGVDEELNKVLFFNELQANLEKSLLPFLSVFKEGFKNINVELKQIKDFLKKIAEK